MDRPSQRLFSKSKKLTIDTFVDGDLLYLRFSGAIDEDFDGKKFAEDMSAPLVVLQLAEIRRLSSFGIREWIDFIQTLGQKAEGIVLVECAPKIVDQINMVANFTGIGQVFSFYAPYRCDHCDKEHRVIMQLDRDWDVIKSMRPPELPCSTCGELQHFDEDPVTYFSYILNQGPIELPQEVSVLLTSPSEYRPSVLELSRRLEIDKLIEGDFTYIRLSGDINAGFPRTKLSDGLEGTVIVDLSGTGKLDPAGAAEWRTFLQMLSPTIEGFYITGVPPLFMEKLGNVADLGPVAQILDFSLSYACTRCGTTAPHRIDVEQQYDQLRRGKAPEIACRECGAPTKCAAAPSVQKQLADLPRPELSLATRAFIDTAKTRKPGRKHPTEAGVTFKKRRSSKALWIAVIALAAVAGTAVAFALLKSGGHQQVVSGNPLGKRVAASAEQRPAWLTSDTQLSAECQTDESLAITCIGVSALNPDLEQAKQEAHDGAVETGLRSVGLLIDDVDWAAEIGSTYGRVRQTKVAEFSNEQLRDPGSMHYQRAKEALIAGRRSVMQALKSVGGQHIDGNPTQEYWERYLVPGSDKEQYLVFVTHQIPADSVEALVKLYGTPQEALGIKLATAFPGLAWLHPTLEGGVVVIDIDDGYLKYEGMLRGHIITALQGRPVKDVDAFIQVLDYQIKSLQEGGGELRMTVDTGGKRPTELNIPASEFQD